MSLTNQDIIKKKIFGFVTDYIEMDIGGIIIHCPYWRNKLREGKVVLRGYLNGKGSSTDIRNKIIETLHNSHINTTLINADYIRKLAKRERIGIDCSGFVYRFLDYLISLSYDNYRLKSLDEVFIGGINKTNAHMLTSAKFSDYIANISNYRIGDMIRLMKGKHVAVILELNDKEIVYVHSVTKTKVKGVHSGKIDILNKNKPLEKQNWLEETETGENFCRKYFYPKERDGVYRLKIFA